MMEIHEVRDQVRAQEWVELIKERNSSGMTIREWCEAKGLSENQYYYWLRKIRRTACNALESNTAHTPQIEYEAPAFAQINVVSEGGQDKTDAGISIRLGRAEIHIGDDVKRSQLETVMKVVANAE